MRLTREPDTEKGTPRTRTLAAPWTGSGGSVPSPHPLSHENREPATQVQGAQKRRRGPGAQRAGIGAPSLSPFPWEGLCGSTYFSAAEPREACTHHDLLLRWRVTTAQLPTPITPGGFGRTNPPTPVTQLHLLARAVARVVSG